MLSNVVVSIEQHVEWIGDHLEYLRKHDLTTTEADSEAQEQWVAHVNEIAGPHADDEGGVVVPRRERSRQAAGLHALCRRGRQLPQICDEVADDDYRGFALS